MKRYHLLASIVGMGLTLAADVALSADAQARAPSTPAAQTSAKLISRAERAINGFVAACTARDVRALSGVTTTQVRVEYALDEPGTYLSMDGNSLLAACAANSSDAHVSNLWIFPTNDANTVFVQYDSGTTASHGQLALIELSGDRISRMVNFAAVPESVVAGLVRGVTTAKSDDGKTAFNNHCRTCHSVKQGDDRLGPSLYGVYGAEAGSIPGFRYSNQGSGIIWDEPTLDRFIANPDQVIANNNMKPYAGITDPAVRKQIINYLKSNRDLQSKH
jgi:cytochrome c